MKEDITQSFLQSRDSSEPTQQEPVLDTPVEQPEAVLPVEAPADYQPSFLRSTGFRNKETIAPTSILTDIGQNVRDDGVMAQVSDWMDDASLPDRTERDFKQINDAIPRILEERGLSAQAGDMILEDAKNVLHAETVADRILRQHQQQAGRDAMSVPAALTSGIGGFFADPLNLIPGVAVIKGANTIRRLVPSVASKLKNSKVLNNSLTKFTAFGIAEEAIRTVPRLQADPTYDHEAYLLNVGVGGLFGAGLSRGLPAARWVANKTITPAFKKLNSALQSAVDKVRESHAARTAANLVTEAAQSSRAAVKNKGIVAAVKAFDTEAVVRTARNKAREDVTTAKAETTLRKNVLTLHSKLSKVDLDLSDPTIIQSVIDSIKSTLGVASKDNKIKEAIQKFEDSVVNITEPKDKGKSAGSAAREETLETKIGDAQQDAKQAYRDLSTQVEQVRKNALEALEGVADTPLGKKARIAIEANAISAVRALEAAAARQGIKVTRKTIKREAIAAKIKDRINNSVPEERSAEVESLLAKLEISHTGINLKTSFKRIIKSLNVPKIGNARESMLNWMLAKKPQIIRRSVRAREATTREFNRTKDLVNDTYTGNPNDKDFLRLHKLLDEQQDELESLFDWVGMSNTKKFTDLTNLDPRWALLSSQFEESLGKAGKKLLEEQYDSIAQKFISNQFGALTESLSAKLVRTKVPLAQWMAMNILELPAGTGGKIARQETAAILSEMNYNEIVVPTEIAWRDMMAEAAREMGLGVIARAKLQNFNPNNAGLQQQIARAVMKEMNARQMGIKSKAPKYITNFADKLTEANDKLYKLQQQHGIEGITGANKMSNYLRQHWNDGAILDAVSNGGVGREAVQELFSKSIFSRANGALTQAEANDLGKILLDLKMEAMNKPQVDSFTLRSENLNGSFAAIEEVIERMGKEGLTSSIENILKWVKSDIGGTPGYVHKRNINLDYNTTINHNGQVISILDLLDNDVIGQVVRYGKEASGRSAISEASGGKLNSEQSIDDFINAMQQQAHELGTHVNTRDVRNMFRIMMGQPYDSQLPMDWRKVRDAVSLAGMNGLGESQLAEFGLATNRGLAGIFAMNQLASKTKGRIKKWRGMKLTDEQTQNTEFLNELQEYSRLYEDMHIVARQNVHFDARESQSTTSMMSKIVDTGTGGKYRPLLQYLQTRYTGYGAVRTMEEQIAMAGLMQDAIKKVKVGESFTTDTRFADVGLDLAILKRKLDDGTITLREDGNIDSLNMHSWSKKEQQSIGVALQRHAGQQVQKGFAGESSPLMNNPQVAMMMQFKSYPLLAAEKQMARNVLHADKEAGMGIALNAASSASARIIRYYSLAMALPEEKRERYLNNKFSKNFAFDTTAYMGTVGMMANNYEMADDLVFGNKGSVADQLPVLNWADNYLKAVKAANPLDEDGITERDVANMQRGAPLGTIMYMNGIMGILRNLMESDEDDKYQNRNNRGS